MDKKTGGARAYMGILLSGVLAGMMISVGGTVYLSVDSKVVGASLFSIGLFFVVSMRLWLYTGKIGYLFRGGHDYAAKLLLTLAGNFAGAFGTALLLRQTRAAANLVGRAECGKAAGQAGQRFYPSGVLRRADVHWREWVWRF